MFIATTAFGMEMGGLLSIHCTESRRLLFGLKSFLHYDAPQVIVWSTTIV